MGESVKLDTDKRILFGSMTTTTTPSTVTNPISGLDDAGNVPLGNSSAPSKMGVEIEKSAHISTTDISLDSSKDFNPKFKGGKSLDKALTEFYGKEYVNAGDEKKEKLIVKYFDWLSKDKKNAISQLDQFKLYRDRCKDEKEYKRLSSVIDKMESKYQFSAAKAVITEGTARQKDIGVKAVADDYQHYDKSVQTGVSRLIVDSKNTEAIKTGASHASQLDKGNQVDVVKIYESAPINNKAKKEVDKIIIDQYKDYAKENQVAIHTVMANSKCEGVAQYAASNIHYLDTENQFNAYSVTRATGNQSAIQAANAQLDQCDSSVHQNIKATYGVTDEDEKEAKAEAPSYGSTEETDDNSNETSAATSDANVATTEEAVAKAEKAIQNNSDVSSLGKMFNDMSDVTVIALLKLHANDPSFAELILQNRKNTSLEVLSEISKNLKKQPTSSTVVLNQFCFLSSEAQISVMKANPSLSGINGNLVNNGEASIFYNSLLQQQKKHYENG